MAEYEGKEVKLNDPFRLPSGSKKKFGVYVKNPKTGNVIKVEFGDPNLSIKRDDPDRLKNFRARHNCDQKTDKTTPGYWSCKFWEKDKPVSKLLKKGKVESVGEGCGCDECMSESKKKKITYVINRRTGEVVYGPTDVADAKQFLKKQPQPRKFVIRDIRESVQLDEQGSIVKTFGNTRDYMPLIKKFGMEKQFRSMMRDLKKFGESGDGLIMIYSDKMLEFIIEPLEDSHYVTKAAQRGGPMTGKNLVKKDVRARGAKGVDARVIAFKESEYNPLDEQKIRTQVEFDSLTDAVKSVKFHPTRDKGREVAIYKLTPPKRTMRTSAERPSGKKVGSVDFQKKTVYTTVTLPNGPFEKILKAKGAKRIATVKNVDGKAKVIKEQKVIQESGHEDVPSAKNKVMMNLVSLKKIHKILCCMNPHASLPSWLTDKLTIATSKLDTVGDYLESQVMQSESTDPNFWLIELNEDEDEKKKKGKNPRDTKYYTKSGRIKKSPEDKETGLPKKYVSRMTDADAKQKAAEIKARKKYGKDDPRRYKPTEVDKKYAGKGEKSKYTKAYDKMFGKDDD